MSGAFCDANIEQTIRFYEDNRRWHLIIKKLFNAFIIIIITMILSMHLAPAQGNTLSGQFEVTDSISDIGNVDLSLVTNPIFNQNGVAVWQIKPDANYQYLDQLKFYAKLDKNSHILSVLLSSDEEYASLRGMIPSLYGDENYALSTTPDEFHKCYEYTNCKSLIYAILIDAFSDLKAKSVISQAAALSKIPSYKCTFSDKLSILGYYITAAEFDDNWLCFHNWPWGSGTDICKYHPEFHGCEYSDGWANIDLNLDAKNTKNYYIYGRVYNDNGEESRISLDDALWLKQIGWGGKNDIKYGNDNIPSKITLYGRKTWSVTSAIIWVAIDADSVGATGHISGDGATHVDRDEDPDVLQSIAMEKGPIEWPIIGQNIIFEDDFSSDKGWITSTPSNFIRDASENNLHWNINECSLKYYQVINPLADDFNLSVDMIFDAELGNTPIDVGLYEDIDYYSPLDTSNLDIRFSKFCNQFMVTIRGTYADGQRFDYPCLDCACTGLHVKLEYGKWYTVKLVKAGSKWYLSVYNKSDNNFVDTASGTFTGEFNAFKYIYIGDLLCGGQENAYGRLDNIKLEAKSASTASISGRVWNDADNNGLQDTLEVGLSAITVNLYASGNINPISTTTTDTRGKYSFRSLGPGNYFVEFISPDVDYIFSPKDLGENDSNDSDVDPNNGRTDVTTIIAGQKKIDIDAGLHSKTSNQFSISGLAWNDTNFNGIQNPSEIGIEYVVVNLYKAGEKVRIKFNITNSTGYYKIENIDPGYYEIRFITPDGYVFSPKDQGGDDSVDSDVNIDSGRTNPITIDQENDNIKLDAGLHKNRPPETPHKPKIKQTGVVGETIAVSTWAVDPDGDKVRFEVNWGYNSINEYTDYVDSGQSAYLYHIFHEARSNKYRVKVRAIDTNDASSVWSDYGEIKISNGEIPQSSIGDFVWNDLNRNGIQDPGETGIGGVALDLYKDGETNPFKTTTTRSEGYYIFKDLDQGSYWIEVNEPSSSYVFSPQLGGYPEKGSDVNPSSKRIGMIYCGGQEDMNYDAGMYSTSTSSSINGLVWNDMNKDGIRDPNENGISDVKIQLFKSGKCFNSYVTNLNGHYAFSDLDAGDYNIGFTLPSGYTFSPVHSVSDISRDSDANTGSGRTDNFYLGFGQSKMNVDAGLY